MVCGAAFTWQCVTQRSVAHSSAEAEYIALDSMGRELEYINMLMHSFNLQQPRDVVFGVHSIQGWVQNPLKSIVKAQLVVNR